MTLVPKSGLTYVHSQCQFPWSFNITLCKKESVEFWSNTLGDKLPETICVAPSAIKWLKCEQSIIDNIVFSDNYLYRTLSCLVVMVLTMYSNHSFTKYRKLPSLFMNNKILSYILYKYVRKCFFCKYLEFSHCNSYVSVLFSFPDCFFPM
jgi:hypothetical protein